LHYNVGRAILLGNLHGVGPVTTIEDFNNWRNSLKYDTMNFFIIPKIKPEKVKTFEFGYKGILAHGRLTLDAGYYISFYRDFIGYKIVIDPDIDTSGPFDILNSAQVYRVATNSVDRVSTQGWSAGGNYFLNKYLMFSGNWSWNHLNRFGSTDPLIPAFNTPENKFNLGVLGMDIDKSIRLFKKEIAFNNYGFCVNYKWVQGYRFEGSPQFTGNVPSYWLLDVQISKQIIKWKSILKIGASNITNNKVYQVYGGPAIGRMGYISLTYEP
jgi:outer membrane receptor protein involved in Fe transport